MINERLTMPEVLEKYHKTGKKKRTSCPIHKGKHNNFCYTDKVFHCWTCGASGNVIGFVMQLFGLSFQEALVRINNDFSLNLPINHRPTYREQMTFRKQNREIQEQKRREQQKKEELDQIISDLWDEWVVLDQNVTAFRPKDSGQEWEPLFTEALKRRGYIEYLIDIWEAERWTTA